MSSPHPSLTLLDTSLFQRSTREEFLDTPSRVELSYKRAKAIGLLHNLSINDINELTSKFWALHTDPILTFDCAAVTLLTIQYNLVLGTLAKYLPERDDLRGVVDDLLQYRMIGQYCLTELRGGLDVLHMGTTATLLDSGEFELHTPTPSDAKFMPPTVPVLGIPCVAIVFSRLIVNGEYRGIRPFLVTLNDGYTMSKGITATLLPPRGGSSPVNHSITSFKHVILPPTSLLGSLDKPKSIHSDFLSHISRLSVGALALATGTTQGIALCASIAGLYNIRRHTTGADGVRVPIITFSTQQKPILTAIALSYVFRALVKMSISLLSSSKNPSVQRGVAVCTKAAIVLRSRASMLELTERCGAQGLYGYNQVSRMFNDIHGTSIAEGDILGLSIRVVIDILMGKFLIPPPNGSSLLATYEEALIQECRESMLSQPPSMDMKEAFNKYILPTAPKIVDAIGHRMAYDAAVQAQLPQYLIDLFVSSTIQRNSSWFVEDGNLKLGRKNIVDMEHNAIEKAMPHFKELLDGLGVREYITAPIVSDDAWDAFRSGLPNFGSLSPSEPIIRAVL